MRRIELFSAGVAIIGAIASVLLFVPATGGVIREVAADFVYPAVAIAAGVAMIAAATTRAGRERLAWALIGAGVLAVGLGDVVWIGYDRIAGEVPYPGWADALYLASYPLWFAGVFALPHAVGGRFERLRMLLDGVVGTVALAGILWTLFLAELVSFEGSSVLEQIVTAAYPVADGLLLTSLMLLVLRRRAVSRDWRVIALAAALLATSVGDVLYLIGFEDYVTGVWYDGLWLFGYTFFALCALVITRSDPVSEPAPQRMRIIEIAFSYAVAVGLMLTSVARIVGDSTFDPVTRAILVDTAIVIVVVMARVAIGTAENRELLERERRELIGSVSHELRTPLTAIQGFVDLLEQSDDELSPAERTEMLKTVAAQSRSLGRIVTDLIEVSRGELASARLAPSEFSLLAAVGEAVAGAGLNPVNVKLDVVDCTVIADRQRFVQILLNLLTNAVRYGGGSIVIAGRRHDQVTQVEVHDDGPGVPPRYRRLIWERFERGANQLNASVPGTGVGLALVQALVQSHGGRVEYRDSELLGGACFAVAIPDHGRGRDGPRRRHEIHEGPDPGTASTTPIRPPTDRLGAAPTRRSA